ITITIADDGRGIDPDRTRNSGLANMKERARRHGGGFSLASGIGGLGAQISWSAPLG
ncbi:MAG: histidine kinase, partial [Schaalia hyovaginalis]|nr:histidine kinase [Schaalia hyovaginalis]